MQLFIFFNLNNIILPVKLIVGTLKSGKQSFGLLIYFQIIFSL